MKNIVAVEVVRKARALDRANSDLVWDAIEKSASEFGLEGMPLTEWMILESVVRKHGNPKSPGYAQLHPNGRGGKPRSGGSGESDSGGKKPSGSTGGGGSAAPQAGTSDGKPAKPLRKIVPNTAIADAVDRAARSNGGEGVSTSESVRQQMDLRSHRAVPVDSSVGLPAGSKGRVVGYRPEQDDRVFVQFERPVTIGGVTSKTHELLAEFDENGPDNFFMTNLKPVPSGG